MTSKIIGSLEPMASACVVEGSHMQTCLLGIDSFRHGGARIIRSDDVASGGRPLNLNMIHYTRGFVESRGTIITTQLGKISSVKGDITTRSTITSFFRKISLALCEGKVIVTHNRSRDPGVYQSVYDVNRDVEIFFPRVIPERDHMSLYDTVGIGPLVVINTSTDFVITVPGEGEIALVPHKRRVVDERNNVVAACRLTSFYTAPTEEEVAVLYRGVSATHTLAPRLSTSFVHSSGPMLGMSSPLAYTVSGNYRIDGLVRVTNVRRILPVAELKTPTESVAALLVQGVSCFVTMSDDGKVGVQR